MPNAPFAGLHPTAVISPEAELADDVAVGPFAVIQGRVVVGPGCIIHPHAFLIGPLTLGRSNQVFAGAVLGERPQHLNYKDEETSVEIGDGNIFREHVTVHRGTTESLKTRIGSHNFFMVNSHVAHDCVIGNRCILANGALVAGHCVLDDNVYLSGNSAVHQFMHLGRLSLLSGCSTTTKDMPPFIIQSGSNVVVGVNTVGMRRAGLSAEQIQGVRSAYQILFREGMVLNESLARLETELGHIDTVRELIDFIRQPGRGINLVREHMRHAA